MLRALRSRDVPPQRHAPHTAPRHAPRQWAAKRALLRRRPHPARPASPRGRAISGPHTHSKRSAPMHRPSAACALPLTHQAPARADARRAHIAVSHSRPSTTTRLGLHQSGLQRAGRACPPGTHCPRKRRTPLPRERVARPRRAAPTPPSQEWKFKNTTPAHVASTSIKRVAADAHPESFGCAARLMHVIGCHCALSALWPVRVLTKVVSYRMGVLA
ncbi:hypothetical protein B0H10DRAFT_1968010 [Mycena sp. CBHHK59/15]|nr:hypothetical protein B0H10DRAFT_1968010 [Mycena sp. CBHHK59/15]